MKKLLFALLASAPAFSMFAESEARVINDYIVGLSTDGRFASSEYYGSIVVYNLDTDDIYDYIESSTNTYGTGNGNFWGLSGMVGYIDNVGSSAIWRGGRWFKLPLAAADPAGMGNANGITPDMNRICGNASTGVGLVLDDAKLMVYPCYWDINSAGNAYGQQRPLPYPTKDLIGHVPQYVTALSITDDGKTIWGQITSGNGFFHEPIVYHQDEAGEWSYDLPMRDICLPAGIEIVPYPGDGPVIPSMENFMTEEELQAYDEAYEKYLKDPTAMKEPTYPEFMSPEEIEKYNEAIEPYLAWKEKYDVYENMLHEIMDKGITFVFNLLRISPDGRYVAMAAQQVYHLGDGETQSIYTPYLYDSVTGEMKCIGIEGYSMLITAVNNYGEVLGYVDAGAADLGYVYQPKLESWLSYPEYLKKRDPRLTEWIDANMVHEVEVELDPTTGETDFVEMAISGRPFVSADWNSFSSCAYNFWGGDDRGEYLSYVIRLDEDSAIQEVESAESTSDATSYFDLQGRRVNNPAGGIFIKVKGGKSEKIAL